MDLGSAGLASKKTMEHLFLKYIFNIMIPQIISVHSCETILQNKDHLFVVLLAHKQPMFVGCWFFLSS